jgi:tripartite-type tricarboxylate transporter receptor subunit TctC
LTPQKKYQIMKVFGNEPTIAAVIILTILNNKGVNMFKKFFAIIFMSLALSSTWAAEKIHIVWGFSPASNQASFYRAIVNELNSIQNKYEFVFEHRPGAGGAVAARYVLSNPETAILGGTSTFFLRSHVDKETGYSTGDFQPALVQTLGAPLVLLSTKHQTLKTAQQSQDFTVSVSGFGSSSHLMGSVLIEALPQTRIINYVTLVDANKDILGEHIDAGWNFFADVDKTIESKRAHGLALTGTVRHKGIPTFKDKGIAGFDQLTSNTAMYVSNKMPREKLLEIHGFLREANRRQTVRAFYALEYSNPADFDYQQTVQWFKQQEIFWAQQSQKIKPF